MIDTYVFILSIFLYIFILSFIYILSSFVQKTVIAALLLFSDLLILVHIYVSFRH